MRKDVERLILQARRDLENTRKRILRRTRLLGDEPNR